MLFLHEMGKSKILTPLSKNSNFEDFEKSIFKKKHETTKKLKSRLILKSHDKINLDEDKRFNSYHFETDNKKLGLKNKIFSSNKNIINIADLVKSKDKLTVIKVKSSKFAHIITPNN